VADEILYDYQAMDQAYENMKRIGNTIDTEVDTMGADALRLLSTISGVYAGEYDKKLKELNQNVTELNEEMTARASQLQAEFNNMGHTDIKLGDGF